MVGYYVYSIALYLYNIRINSENILGPDYVLDLYLYHTVVSLFSLLGAMRLPGIFLY